MLAIGCSCCGARGGGVGFARGLLTLPGHGDVKKGQGRNAAEGGCWGLALRCSIWRSGNKQCRVLQSRSSWIVVDGMNEWGEAGSAPQLKSTANCITASTAKDECRQSPHPPGTASLKCCTGALTRLDAPLPTVIRCTPLPILLRRGTCWGASAFFFFAPLNPTNDHPRQSTTALNRSSAYNDGADRSPGLCLRFMTRASLRDSL